jgi:hypothetical protein
MHAALFLQVLSTLGIFDSTSRSNFMREATQHEITAETQIRGFEFRDFWHNFMAPNWAIEDVRVDFDDEDGNYILDDEGTFRLGDFGNAVWQGNEESRPDWLVYGYDLIPVWHLYSQMKHSDPRRLIALRVPEDRMQELREFVTRIGGMEA